MVEWFDFAVYGFLPPIIARTFFPTGDPVVSLLQTFTVFAVAFALRPVGGAFFGALGDRIGRRKVLALTVQGLSAGGEHAGAAAYVIEHAPADQRSRFSSATPPATFGSFAAAALLAWALTAGLGSEAMNAWSWRIPFLVAIPLGIGRDLQPQLRDLRGDRPVRRRR